MSAIHAVTMPKWGLAMKEGRIARWLIEEGAEVQPGLELVEIETEKILGSLESTSAGILRRKVAADNTVVPVAGLLGVTTGVSVPDSQIDSFISDFQAHFVPQEGEREASGPAAEIVDVGGLSLRYLKLGKGGEPAILIHGFGGDLNSWMFNHETLAADRAVYALELPGHGASSKQVGGGTIAEFASILGHFMDALNLPRAHLAGHSMGGAVAIEFALGQPERTVSLTLIASLGLGTEIDGEYIEGFIQAGRRKEIAPQVQKLFADPKLVSRQMIEDILRYKRLDGVEQALRTIAAQFYQGGRQTVALRDQLGRLPMPVSVIWGAEDRILPASQARELPKNIKAEILNGVGHMAQMEAAQEVSRLMLSFWQSISK